ncbi:MAG: GNAT family N-acetyltransferase [Calditrichaeota bacterium]|nr:GNAT family N-acetyltransferase [Calditrichota bacterium]MCB9369271.1 GNAT family N-acetyltransferase [Calditrichota bacterium]
MTIHSASTPNDLRRIYPVVHELRPHLTEEQFIAQAQRQADSQDYLLIYVEVSGGNVAGVAGYRPVEMLHWGKVLYIDDLVTAQTHRGQGVADHLFNYIVNQARKQRLDAVHLDSGTHAGRWDAHRFYLKHGMNITSYHFVLNLKQT